MSPCCQSLRHQISFSFITWVRYYICFCKAAAFLSGLLISRKVVDLAVVGVLITYFSDYKYSESEEFSLRTAAIFASIQDGISATLAVIAAWISYYAIRPLRILIFSTVSYILALGLLFFTASRDFSETKFELLNMIGMILLAVGEVGVAPLLGPFLAEQLRAHGDGGRTENPDENQVMAQKRVWWRFTWCCGVGVAYYANNIDTWDKTFRFTLLVMGGSLIFFLLGIPFYHSRQLPPADGFAIIRVVKAAMKKKHVNYPRSAEGNVVHLSPRIKLLRWIDKAIIDSPGTLCTVAQVTESKSLLKLLPMMSSFIVFGLVLSAGNTLFPEQGANMLSKEFLIFLLTFKDIIRAAISYISKKLISKCGRETKQRQAQVVRTLIGMVMSTTCCLVAWQVEMRRLEKHKRNEKMSMFWLVPQFCLLGLMEGLALDGCNEYSSSHFPERMEYHVSAITYFFIGIGSVFNIFFILANKGDFADKLDDSGLHKYYLRLAFISGGNVLYNLLLSILYIRIDRNVDNEGLQTTNPTDAVAI